MRCAADQLSENCLICRCAGSAFVTDPRGAMSSLRLKRSGNYTNVSCSVRVSCVGGAHYIERALVDVSVSQMAAARMHFARDQACSARWGLAYFYGTIKVRTGVLPTRPSPLMYETTPKGTGTQPQSQGYFKRWMWCQPHYWM